MNVIITMGMTTIIITTKITMDIRITTIMTTTMMVIADFDDVIDFKCARSMCSYLRMYLMCILYERCDVLLAFNNLFEKLKYTQLLFALRL